MLSIDTLKIDRSFVRDLAMDENDASIVVAMIWMGNNLHMKVVAEGVETREQLEILQDTLVPTVRETISARRCRPKNSGNCWNARPPRWQSHAEL